MGLKPDHWIKKYALEHRMIEPFVENQVRQGVISYGVSSYGYDIRVADEYKIFTNVYSAVVDPKHFDPKSMIDFQGEICVIPPNSFALARTVEYFRIPRGVLTVCLGKCLTGDTRVVDATTGNYVTLKDFIAQQTAQTATWDGQQLRPQTVTAHVNNGRKPVFWLKTRAGLKVKATANHPFRTWEGWTPLENLQIGARIAVARSCPIFGQEEWSSHEATLLGLMLADGQCDTPGHSPRYTTGDPYLAEVATQAAQAMGGAVTPVAKYGYNLVNHAGRGGVPKRNLFTAWLEKHGCNVRSADKRIPEVVFTARRERVAEFLRALFAGDGSVYDSNGGFYLEYYTISETLAYDVRHLLLRFGLFSLVRSKKLKDGSLTWSVQITDRTMITHFAIEIGFIPGSRKQARLAEVVQHLKLNPARKSNFDTLPPAAWGNLRDAVHEAGASLNGIGLHGTNPAQSLPYTIARQATAALALPEFAAQVEAEVVWDTVVAIEPAGEEEVYDLTVPESHNFLANDIIVHNSTYARCGIIVNVTPFEPEWEGFVTLEISNTTPLPARIYSNEGIAQVLFFEGDEPCDISYADKKGKYQGQQTIVLPKL